MASWYIRSGKRFLDISISLLALVLFLPILLVIAFAARLTLGKCVIYAQKRPGIHGSPFFIKKFRTMSDITDDIGKLSPDHMRLISFGRFLRRTSLDELPELINVIRGEMSLVGPRPLLMEYLDRYSLNQARRMEVRPGITGWAQVNGRNATTWEERFAHDIWYVDNCSLGLDLKILWLTLVKVLRREGINQPGQATMEKFRGEGGSSD